MADSTRDRAKEHFPAVLVTLLSIVQAIALELLWSHIVEAPDLYTQSIDALVAWAQVGATLLVIVLIWVVYASNVMRFRWVPTVPDSVYPFAVGIVEFWLVETLGPGSSGLWFMIMGTGFGVMTWIAQITMRKARFDPDNAQFFATVGQATLADFYPQIAVVLLFEGVGVLIIADALPPLAEPLAVLLTLVFLAWQFRSTARYWAASVSPTSLT